MAKVKGTFAATAADSVVLAADEFRSEVNIQHRSGDEAFIGFGELAVVDEGMSVSSTFPVLLITGPLCGMAIHMICDGAGTAGGGYQTI